jgi:sulfate transport system substrate-binding protein
VAEAYLQCLYSKEGQAIEAKNYYRPRDPAIVAQTAKQFPKIKMYTIDGAFGGWTKAQAIHFADGGVFDQIYKPGQ